MLFGGCTTTVPEKDHQVSGRVTTEAGASLGRAQVRLGSEVVLATDATGAYTTQLERTPGTRLVATFSAPGYATVYRSIVTQQTAVTLPAVRLRAVDRQVNVTLPGAGDLPVVIQVRRGEGAATLTLDTGSVVVPGGNVVQGSIQVAMTYWHPQEALDSAPALLVANENSTAVPLTTFGMAAIELWQNGNLLQVAPNHTVALSFNQPAGTLAKLGTTMPNLYYLDPNVGIWNYEGSINDGTLTFDKAAGTFNARLPHLSAWNVDGSIYPSGGGCVQGHVYDACHPATPLVGTALKVWFLDAEETKDFAATTDKTGFYCVATPISNYEAAYNMQNGDSQVDVHYFLSSASDITNTPQCDPLPLGACRSCDPFYESWSSTARFCNKCEMIIPGDPGLQDPNIPIEARYADTCAPNSDQIASLLGCHFCSGDPNIPAVCTLAGSSGRVTVGSCTNLAPLYMRPAGCNCQYVGAPCGPGASCCADVSGNAAGCGQKDNKCGLCNKTYGNVCSIAAGDICCGNASTGPLTCVDNLCVPIVDPAFSE